MWINQQGRTVGDNEQYEGPDGTTYPSNFPKGEIEGLTYVPDPDPAPLPPERIEAMIVAQTQARLDTFARNLGYDSILSACTYASSSVPRFKSDGQYCVDARDGTWSALWKLLQSVKDGGAKMPTGFADVEPLLPALTWPDPQ